MSKIERSDIEKVALLSRLAFTPEEADRFAGQLSRILDYADKIKALDTEGVEPTSHSIPMTNVFRDDAPRPGLTREQALANAPEAEDGCFRVPQIIQESS
jgi:aspartyl-tRNA(Asn)/glutamyl-tRNA(Gln) amidotransferase subunit C